MTQGTDKVLPAGTRSNLASLGSCPTSSTCYRSLRRYRTSNAMKGALDAAALVVNSDSDGEVDKSNLQNVASDLGSTAAKINGN
jgi:hypothetical protein